MNMRIAVCLISTTLQTTSKTTNFLLKLQKVYWLSYADMLKLVILLKLHQWEPKKSVALQQHFLQKTVTSSISIWCAIIHSAIWLMSPFTLSGGLLQSVSLDEVGDTKDFVTYMKMYCRCPEALQFEILLTKRIVFVGNKFRSTTACFIK